MPIQPSLALKDLSQADFDHLDKVVMRHAYASHNKFGRLFDERVYENDLAKRLRADGFAVHTQVPVKVWHASFEKTYFLDLIVNDMLYELKVASALLAEHRAQALHYAMLNNISRAKLINFRSTRVAGDLLYNALTETDRHRAAFHMADFRAMTAHCERLLTHVCALAEDWGTHLSSRLYNEALLHHFGGETQCLQRISVSDGEDDLGTHLVQCHSPGHCFIVTSVTREKPSQHRHLQCLLDHLSLQSMQWINFNHATIEFTTLHSKR